MEFNLSMTSQSQFSYLVDNRICRVPKRKLAQVVVIVIPSSSVSWCLRLPVPTLDPPSPWCHLECLGTCVALSATVLGEIR